MGVTQNWQNNHEAAKLYITELEREVALLRAIAKEADDLTDNYEVMLQPGVESLIEAMKEWKRDALEGE